MSPLRRLALAWRLLRTWTGDDAYDDYLRSHAGHHHEVLSRREFYRRYFEERGKRPRCC